MASLKDLPRIVKNLIEQEVILEEGAKVIRERIPKRTRLGNGVRQNLGPTHKLPKLKPTTVKIRKSLKKKGALTGPGATPAKSGFNRTGDTLENLNVSVTKKQISVELDDNDKAKLQDAINLNSDYQFMRLSAAEFKEVLRAITKKLEEAIKKVNFTKF